MFDLSRAEEQQLIEEFYRQRVAHAASDEDELRIVQDLLEKSRNGFVIGDDGQPTYYRQSGMPVNAPFLVADQGKEQAARVPLLPLLAFLVLAAFALVPLLTGKEETLTPEPTATLVVAVATQTLTPTTGPSPTATPSPTPTPTATPTLTPTPLPPEEVEIKPEPVKLEPGAVVPVSLEIAGRYFPIVPTTLRDETWAYQTDPNQVSWLAGSAVNVVLGLPYTAANLDLVNSLSLSDTLAMRTSAGGVFAYALVERRRVGVYQIEAFDQRRAGLTLALLGGDEEDPSRRLILWAVASTPLSTSPATDGKEDTSQTTGQ